MNLFDVITEALPLRIAKTYRKAWDPLKYQELFSRFTENPKAYRIYLPLEADTPKKVKVPTDIAKAIEEAGFIIDDYIEGFASKGNQKIKIGKILNRINKPELKMKFDADKQRQGKNTDNLLVVISRHPYDIAGMSTGRKWTSCMTIKTKPKEVGHHADQAYGGSNSKYVLSDVKAGTLIAYLIDKNDRNIKNPKARMLIKPFINPQTKAVILVGEGSVYGTSSGAFKKTVNSWLQKVNADKITGMYVIASNLYQDDISSTRKHKGVDHVVTSISPAELKDLIKTANDSDMTLASVMPKNYAKFLNTPEHWKILSDQGYLDLMAKNAAVKKYFFNQFLKTKKYEDLSVFKFSDSEIQKLIANDPRSIEQFRRLSDEIQAWILKNYPKYIGEIRHPGKPIFDYMLVHMPNKIDWENADSSYVLKHGVEVLEKYPDKDIAIGMLSAICDHDAINKMSDKLICTMIHAAPQAVLTSFPDYCDGLPDVAFRYAFAYHFDILKKILPYSDIIASVPERYLIACANKDPSTVKIILNNSYIDNLSHSTLAAFIKVSPVSANRIFDDVFDLYWDDNFRDAVKFVTKYDLVKFIPYTGTGKKLLNHMAKKKPKTK